jgi:hypothetical protein
MAKRRRRSSAHDWAPIRADERALVPFTPHAPNALALAYANSYHVGMSSLAV